LLYLVINSKTIELFSMPTPLSHTATFHYVKQAGIKPHIRSTFMNFAQCRGKVTTSYCSEKVWPSDRNWPCFELCCTLHNIYGIFKIWNCISAHGCKNW